jgi:hypothetical protein
VFSIPTLTLLLPNSFLTNFRRNGGGSSSFAREHTTNEISNERVIRRLQKQKRYSRRLALAT